jgi:hypothetical protein
MMKSPHDNNHLYFYSSYKQNSEFKKICMDAPLNKHCTPITFERLHVQPVVFWGMPLCSLVSKLQRNTPRTSSGYEPTRCHNADNQNIVSTIKSSKLMYTHTHCRCLYEQSDHADKVSSLHTHSLPLPSVFIPTLLFTLVESFLTSCVDSMFPQNTGIYIPDYTVSKPRR